MRRELNAASWRSGGSTVSLRRRWHKSGQPDTPQTPGFDDGFATGFERSCHPPTEEAPNTSLGATDLIVMHIFDRARLAEASDVMVVASNAGADVSH